MSKYTRSFQYNLPYYCSDCNKLHANERGETVTKEINIIGC